jgi:D-ribose pyranase
MRERTAPQISFDDESRLLPKGGFSRMIIQGILNPQVNSLLARVRHTNSLVIADRGFPYWPVIETIDLSLVDDIPTVLQVLGAIRLNFHIGQIHMAQEFLDQNKPEVRARFTQSAAGIPVFYEPHAEFKKRIPQAVGLIRTADTIQYANMILVSA